MLKAGYNTRVFASILIAAQLTIAGSFDGYDLKVIPSGNLYSRGWEESDRARVIRLLPRVLTDLEDLLGRKLNRPFTTVLTPDGFELQRLVEEWSGNSLPEKRRRPCTCPLSRFRSPPLWVPSPGPAVRWCW